MRKRTEAKQKLCEEEEEEKFTVVVLALRVGCTLQSNLDNPN